jgi:hypothetical protein
MLKSLRLSKNFTQRGNIKNGALGTGFKLIEDNIYIYIYITCFSGIYVLSEVGVQIELLILRFFWVRCMVMVLFESDILF